MGPLADRRLNLLVAVSFLTALAIITFAIVSIPKILSSASTTEALDHQNEVSACRASYRTTLVDDPMATLQVARARLDERTNAGLEAVARGDDDSLAALLDNLPALRDRVEQAAVALEDGTTAYRELVALSASDTEAFLVRCNTGSTA